MGIYLCSEHIRSCVKFRNFVSLQETRTIPTRNMRRLYEKSKKQLNVMLQTALMELDSSNINKIVYTDCGSSAIKS
jgi:hypothetical protein